MQPSGDAATADDIFQRALADRRLTFTRGEDGAYRVLIGDGEVLVSLENIRRTYARDKDAGAVIRFAGQLGAGLLTAPPDWETVTPFLRYSIEPSNHEGGLGDAVRETVTDELTKVIVFTSPDGARISWVTTSMLTSWKVTRDDVVARATENMDRLASEATLEIREVGGVKLGMLSTRDRAFKASLILSKRFRDVVSPSHGWPVLVVVPARDFAYVLAVKDRAFLDRLGRVVVEEFEASGYPISRDVLEVGDSGVEAVASFAPRPR